MKSKSFTLIELLVVIAIIGILAGIIVVSVSSATTSAQIAKLKVFNNSVRDSLGANLVSEWKFDEVNNPSANYTPDTWSSNHARLGDGSTSSTFPILLQSSDCASNSCFSYNGASNYLRVASSNELSFGNSITDTPFTISTWVNIGTVSGFVIIYKENEFFWTNNNSLRFYLYDQDTYNAIYRSAINLTPYLNKWTHLVMVYNGDQTANGISFYINGEKTSYGTAETAGTYTAMHATGGELRIGNTTTNGKIDDTRIYNTDLKASSIKQLYFAGLYSLLAKNLITKQQYSNRIISLEFYPSKQLCTQ
ncbi:MAG: LamG domain-containing protein [Candidatus Paceibacterota bacterium]